MRYLSLLLVFVALTVTNATQADDTDVPVGPSALEISPNAYDFGDVAVGLRRYAEFTVTNRSTMPLWIPHDIAGQNRTFYVAFNRCPIIQPLAAGEQCEIHVVFRPAQAAPFTSSLTVHYGPAVETRTDYAALIPLTGQGQN